MSKQPKNKKKKDKITYIDDGRTIADMSGTSKGGLILSTTSHNKGASRPRSSFKEVWKTYWSSVKMMLLPMAVVIALICIVYLIMYLSMR